jgi:hypothetical protein
MSNVSGACMQLLTDLVNITLLLGVRPMVPIRKFSFCVKLGVSFQVKMFAFINLT